MQWQYVHMSIRLDAHMTSPPFQSEVHVPSRLAPNGWLVALDGAITTIVVLYLRCCVFGADGKTVYYVLKIA